MAHIARSFVLAAGVALVGVSAVAVPGCGGHEEAAEAEPTGLIADYTVRGQVASLPEAGKPASSFRVHHEPIPEWKKNYNQPPVGMNAMTMEFPPASPEVIEGIAVGDVVSLTFRVEYDEEGMLKGWTTTRVEKLPADTELVFE
ncbi:MAG: copper-binding protein [Phycisphaerales bacterium]